MKRPWTYTDHRKKKPLFYDAMEVFANEVVDEHLDDFFEVTIAEVKPCPKESS